MIFFICAPFGMGYKYMFGHCLADFWKVHCASTVAELYLVVTAVNLPLLIFTLSVIIIGILLSHSHGTGSSNVKKVERRLVWQTISSSIFLIIYYVCHYIGALLYEEYTDIAIQLYTSCTLWYAIHTYLPIIILFVVR